MAAVLAAQRSHRFGEIELPVTIARAIEKMGFTQPTEVQARAIAPLRAGRDLIGQAQTGTGKTAAFGIPIVEKVDPNAHHVQALVLTPTRELCVQVTEEIRRIGVFRNVAAVAIYGGSSMDRQVTALKRGAQVRVARFVRYARHGQDSIDHRVARDEHVRGGHALTQQVLTRGRCRCEMQVGHHAGQPPEHFLRPRLPFVAAAQSRFNVAHARSLVERDQSRGKYGRSVTFDQHDVRPVLANDGAKAGQTLLGHIVEVLAFAHDVQVPVGPELEHVEHLVHQMSVLARERDARLDLVVSPSQRGDHGGELDTFRTCPDDDEHAPFHASEPASRVVIARGVLHAQPSLQHIDLGTHLRNQLTEKAEAEQQEAQHLEEDDQIEEWPIANR